MSLEKKKRLSQVLLYLSLGGFVNDGPGLGELLLVQLLHLLLELNQGFTEIIIFRLQSFVFNFVETDSLNVGGETIVEILLSARKANGSMGVERNKQMDKYRN